MDPIGRVVMGGLAVFVAWTLVRAWQTGVIYSEGWGFDIHEQPTVYVLGYATHVLIVVAALGMAAGYTLAEEEHLVWMLLTGGR
jgi:hypothetical protein